MAVSPTDRAGRAQRLASTPGLSAWVDASAGSGKTKVLTDRALRLMLSGAAPDRILCLTFTKAAAAEMANRIISRLSQWAAADKKTVRAGLASIGELSPDDGMIARAATLFARVIDAPGGLKVQTVHSFCQSALERFPVEAGVPPGFAALDERAAADLLRGARDHTLQEILAGEAADDQLLPALDRIVLRSNADAFDQMISTLLSERARIETLGDLDAAIKAAWSALGIDNADAADSEIVSARIAQPGDIIEARLRKIMDAWLGGGKTDVGKGEKLAAWLSASQAVRADTLFDLFSAFFKTGGEGDVFATAATKAVRTANPWFEERHDDCAQWAYQQRERIWAADCAADTAAALRLADAIGKRYQRAKRVAAGLDFDDLILKTRDLLEAEGGAGWALYKLDSGVDHILVDEAQDTNPEQWAIVHALAREFYRDGSDVGRTLFAVGDPKQSIFSFQRADPKEFAESRRLFKDLAESAGQDFEDTALDVSFRSVPAILEAVDAVFKPPAAHAGLAPEPAETTHISARPGLPGRVELWPLLPKLDSQETPDRWTPLKAYPDNAASPEARLAVMVAEKIEDLLSDPEERIPPSESHPKGRRIQPRDIMIVVQTRSGFGDALARVLKTKDIETAGVDRMKLTQQLVVRDLIALGTVAVLPEDDLSLAVLLKSPLIGLSEKALFDLSYGRHKQPLWQTLRDKARAGDADLQSAWAFVSEAMGRADFAPPFDFYQWALTAEKGRTRLLSAHGEAAKDPLDAFLALALDYNADHAPSLQGFLGWIERDQVEIKRQMEEGAGGVRILTAHAAKGLQAPIVFLPQTTKAEPQYRLGLFWADTEAGSAPILGPSRQALDPDCVKALRAARATAQEQERRRLLYVALTRAEDRLYVCGWDTGAKPDVLARTWHGLTQAGLESIARHQTQAVDYADEPMLILDDPGEHGLADDIGLEDLITARHPLPDWWGAPIQASPGAAMIQAPSRLIADPPPDAPPVLLPLDWGDKSKAAATRFSRGLIIHRLLEKLPALPSSDRHLVAARYLTRTETLSDIEQADILAAVFRVLDHPDFAALFQPDSLAEASIAGMIGGQPVGGIIDRMRVTDDEVLIVDYKSNRPPPSTAEATPPQYLTQMAAYRDLATQTFPGRTVKTALLWTEAPRLVVLPNALLDAHAIAG